MFVFSCVRIAVPGIPGLHVQQTSLQLMKAVFSNRSTSETDVQRELSDAIRNNVTESVRDKFEEKGFESLTLSQKLEITKAIRHVNICYMFTNAEMRKTFATTTSILYVYTIILLLQIVVLFVLIVLLILAICKRKKQKFDFLGILICFILAMLSSMLVNLLFGIDGFSIGFASIAYLLIAMLSIGGLVAYNTMIFDFYRGKAFALVKRGVPIGLCFILCGTATAAPNTVSIKTTVQRLESTEITMIQEPQSPKTLSISVNLWSGQLVRMSEMMRKNEYSLTTVAEFNTYFGSLQALAEEQMLGEMKLFVQTNFLMLVINEDMTKTYSIALTLMGAVPFVQIALFCLMLAVLVLLLLSVSEGKYGNMPGEKICLSIGLLLFLFMLASSIAFAALFNDSALYLAKSMSARIGIQMIVSLIFSIAAIVVVFLLKNQSVRNITDCGNGQYGNRIDNKIYSATNGWGFHSLSSNDCNSRNDRDNPDGTNDKADRGSGVNAST